MKAGEGLRGRRTDGRELQVAQGPQVATSLFEPPQEKPNAVRRRKHQPFIVGQAIDGPVERRRVGDRPHFDRRRQQHFGTQRLESGPTLEPLPRADG